MDKCYFTPSHHPDRIKTRRVQHVAWKYNLGSVLLELGKTT